MKIKCSEDKLKSCSDKKTYSKQITRGKILCNAIAILNILQKYYLNYFYNELLSRA